MFDFDEAKSAANRPKQGIDFPTARALWHDRRALRIPVRRSAAVEPRRLVAGRIDGRLWTAVVTERGDRIRIISVRRARPEEARAYERADEQ
ncbi:BrnT family toxin [Sphingomonas phyllosphaerae]|uniref:BrnT family toxin n=1 Tax=Sphingomonas phyllosphaerae TaxID=257003 RepID=UPI0024131253|nr:BrnT family toxin [Sphingomonas phyllosphaerae]